MRKRHYIATLRNIVIACLVIGWSAIVASARPNSPYDVKPSRNIGSEPFPTRAEYLAKFPEQPLSLQNVSRYSAVGGVRRDEEGGIALVVTPRLQDNHGDAIQVWINDLNGAGWEVTLISAEGGSAQELKDLVIEQGGEGLVGVIFLGAFPLAWFEEYEYFDDGAEPDNQILETYPIDLFFTDLNGVWADTDSNGVYDSHTGEWSPELWLGRIAAYNLSQLDEDTIVADYLDRIHRYRLGELHLPHRALAFIDDDWGNTATEWQQNAELAFGRVKLVAEPESTSATAYREELIGDGYELVQVAVHSTADSHAFWINQRHERDYFRFRHLRDETIPQALFYNLFACKAMDLRGNLCMGSLYALKGPFGLAAVGSAKTGGMLYYDDFYRPLADGVPIGESLRRWFAIHGREEGHENWSRSWFYGMTCFGDPTLTLVKGLVAGEVTVEDPNGDADGYADVGETLNLAISSENRSAADIGGVQATLVSFDSLVTVEESVANYGDIRAGSMSGSQAWRLNLSRRIPNEHIARLELELTSENGETWWIPISLTTYAPVVKMSYFGIPFGSPDFRFTAPGESGELLLFPANYGGHSASNEQVEFTSLDGLITIQTPTDSIGRMNPRARVRADLSYTVLGTTLPSQIGLVRAIATDQGVENGRYIFSLPFTVESRFSDALDDSVRWMLQSPVKEGFANVWRWAGDAGEGSGGLAFGGPDSTFYPAQADAVVELPGMMLAAGARLTIRHRIDAEEQYDAATVEVSDGEAWTRATPVDGYNGVGADNGSFTGGPCWNGSFDWRTDVIPINDQSGFVQVRLRFASDMGIENLGWRIDRLEVEGTPAGVPAEIALPNSPTLVEVYPNPFNSTLTVKIRGKLPDGMALYDLEGRLVRKIETSSRIGTSSDGIHSIQINEVGLAAGIYYLHWESGTNQGTVKTALVK